MCSEARYGEVLGPYLDDPSNLFVISSDFCHWGSRFTYTWYEPSHGAIWESITWLDKQGMEAIETVRQAWRQLGQDLHGQQASEAGPPWAVGSWGRPSIGSRQLRQALHGQ